MFPQMTPYRADDLRVKDVFQGFLVGHVMRVFLRLFGHGDSYEK